MNWTYLLFVQIWPLTWLYEDHKPLPSYIDYWTIHGIWPQYSEHKWPQYCKGDSFNASALEPLQPELDWYWTDFRDPEKFHKHEWDRHGKCAESDPLLSSEYEFFKKGLELRKMYPIYEELKKYNITPSSKLYSREKFPRRMCIRCKGEMIESVIVCIDKRMRRVECVCERNCPKRIRYIGRGEGGAAPF